jgi:hypothetical protein
LDANGVKPEQRKTASMGGNDNLNRSKTMARMVAQKTYDAVMMDSLQMLSSACFMDFGMDRCDDAELSARFGALQTAARQGATVDQFDEALGDSAKLTALVALYGSDVVFPPTGWELMDM